MSQMWKRKQQHKNPLDYLCCPKTNFVFWSFCFLNLISLFFLILFFFLFFVCKLLQKKTKNFSPLWLWAVLQFSVQQSQHSQKPLRRHILIFFVILLSEIVIVSSNCSDIIVTFEMQSVFLKKATIVQFDPFVTHP